MMIRITNIILKILLLLQGHQKTDILDRVILPCYAKLKIEYYVSVNLKQVV